MKRLHLAPLALAAVLAACGGGSSAPSLTMTGPASHASHFPIAATDTHGAPVGKSSPECNACHWDKAATPPGPSATFKIYTCTNCHVLLRSGLYHDDPQSAFSAWHATAGVNQFDATVAAANVMGVGKLDAACRSCHPSGIGVDHAAIFTLPHQDATATVVAKCADCHVDPANRKVLGCAACHPHDLAPTATAHARVPDFKPTDSTLCARCHEDAKIPVAVSAHASRAGGFTVGVGTHAGSAGGACLSCHPQLKTTTMKTYAADFKVTTCVGCHVAVGGTTAFHDSATSLAPLHASVTDFNTKVASLGLSAACFSCHPDGAGGAPSNHEQLFPRAAGTQHAGISCAQCHGTGARNDLKSLQCASCHLGKDATLTAKHGTVGGVAILTVHTSQSTTGPSLTMTSPDCLRCHADSQVDRIATHNRGDAGFSRAQHNQAGCVTCHSANRPATQKPYPAVNWKTTPGCAICHPGGIPN